MSLSMPQPMCMLKIDLEIPLHNEEVDLVKTNGVQVNSGILDVNAFVFAAASHTKWCQLSKVIYMMQRGNCSHG